MKKITKDQWSVVLSDVAFAAICIVFRKKIPVSTMRLAGMALLMVTVGVFMPEAEDEPKWVHRMLYIGSIVMGVAAVVYLFIE